MSTSSTHPIVKRPHEPPILIVSLSKSETRKMKVTLHRPQKRTLLLICLSLIIACCALVGVEVLRTISANNSRQLRLRSIYETIAHYSASIEIYRGRDIGVGSATDSIDCRTTNHFGFFGTNAPINDVEGYYDQEFARHGWAKHSGYMAFSVDRNTRVAILRIKPGAGPFVPGIAYQDFYAAMYQYTTLYVVSVNTWVGDQCPQQ